MAVTRILSWPARAISLLDLALVFAIADGGFAYFVLGADRKPLLALAIPVIGIALTIAATLAGDEVRAARLLLGAALVLGACFSAAFVAGHPAQAPFHDSVLLTDAAADRLVAGQDPYGHDYLRTAGRYFYTPDVPVNFGIRHFVYPPGLILLDSPLRWWAARGGPDVGAAVLYAPAMAALAISAASLRGGDRYGAAGVIAVALNPLMVADANVQFFNDVFFLAPLIAGIAFLQRDRPRLGWLMIGVSLCFKQQPVLVLPFLGLLAVRTLPPRAVVGCALAAAVPPLIVSAPFALWNPIAFFNDVAAFFYSSGVDNYPIRGLGLPGLLYEAGVIPDRWNSFPSAPFQLVGSGGLVVLGLVWLARAWTWQKFWLVSAAVAFSVFFFGRVLAPNYIDFALVLATVGGALVVRRGVTVRSLAAAPGLDLVPAGTAVSPHA